MNINNTETDLEGIRNTDIFYKMFLHNGSAKIEGTLTSIINGNWSLENSFQNGLIGTKQDLKITINDDLSSIKYFQVTASGIKL